MRVAIVGAGLVGRLVALELLKDKDIEITIYEKGSKDGVDSAGFTAAGMLAPYAELETAESVIFDLGHKSMELWPDILKQIGLFDGYQQNGTIITAHPQDLSELEHFIGMLQKKINKAKDIKLLDKDASADLEPDVKVNSKAFYITDEGVIDAQRFIAFSTNYLDIAPNVQFKEHTKVDKIESGAVYTSDGVSEYDWVFDTRGLGAKEHFSTLRGVRGEVLWIESNDINITRPTRLMHPRYKIYIVPRGNGCEGIDLDYCKECKMSASQSGHKRYIVGATEIESEDMSDISVRSSMELLSALYSVNPSFGEARVVHSETNCRPAFGDNLPRIENSDKLTRINGLYRHGYLLGPAIVKKAIEQGIRSTHD